MTEGGGRDDRITVAQRPIQVGLGTNLALAAVKLVAGVFGHSYALIADAAESGADVLTSMAFLFGLAYAAKPADSDHPHGHGKAEPLAAAAVALALFAAAGWIARDSAQLIVTPHPLPAPFTLVVVIAVLIAKEMLFRYVNRVGERVDSTAVKADAIHQRTDVFVSGAALVGISVALIGGKGFESADDWAALFASAIIVYNGFTMLSGAVGELLDKEAPPELLEQVRALASEMPDVMGTHRCHVRKMGMDLVVELDVLVNGGTSVDRAHEVAHAVQDHIRAKMPAVRRVLVHIEPAGGARG
jgi:cation diffusion facilitator family transporter